MSKGALAQKARDDQQRALMILPATFEEWLRLADLMAKSDIVPKEYLNKPGNCLVAMQMGVAVGLNPFQAIQSIAVINGRPCMWGDAVLGIVEASGLLEDFAETDDGEMATCRAKRKGRPTEIVRTFSMQDAQQAKVWDKESGKMRPLAERGVWQSYAKRMRQMRARGWTLRDGFSDVLKGIHPREEVEDYSDEPGEPKPVGSMTLEERAEGVMPKRKGEAPPPQPAKQTGDPGVERAGQPPVDAPATTTITPPTGDVTVAGAAPEVTQGPAAPPKTTFTIGKQQFETAGITRNQMLATFKLCPAVDKKYGAGRAEKLRLEEFKVEHRDQLTEEDAGKYIIRLQEMLEAER